MRREKYKTRIIRLIGAVQLQAARAILDNLPIDPDHPLEIVVREEVKKRGLDANGYYFMRIGEIAEQAWVEGKKFSKDAWHEYAKKNIMSECVVTKDGETRSKWEQTPYGSMSVISTTLLERGCFADYTTAVEAFGASLGVQFKAME